MLVGDNMNLKLNKKKILSLLVLGNIVLSHVPHANAEMKVEGDKIKANTTVNIRLDNNLDGERISSIKNNQVATRILSCDNGWDLISYNGKLGFVKDEFFTDISDENIYCDIDFTEARKILKTSDKVNMRIDPFIESDLVGTIPGNTNVEVMALSSNNWYLVNYAGKLGFVFGDYLEDAYCSECNNDVILKDVVRAKKEVNIRKAPSTNSERFNILYENEILDYLGTYNKDWYMVDYYGETAYISSKYSSLEEIEYLPYDYIKVVEIKNDTELLSMASVDANTIGYLEQYETGEVLSIENDYYLIRTQDKEGYVKKRDTKNLTGLFVVIDISEQKLLIYQDNKRILESNVVTGKDTSKTPLGDYAVQYKALNYTLTGPGYVCPVSYWIQFNGNYGIHDYNMNGKFGGNIFHKNGSHGCVRMHIIPAGKVYNLVKRGTPVIIHK